MKHRMGSWLAACAGALWSAAYMWPMLNPFKLDVVFRDDWAQHVLGWSFFRNETLTLPLGALRNFLHPLGTTVGYMDAIPWLALLLRPFSSLLPVDFHYLGIWICLCSATLAYAGARVAALSTPHWEQQAMAGAFTAMAPTLMERVVHPALCGHVFLVLSALMCFAPAHGPTAIRHRMIAAFSLTALVSATHPYTALMVLSTLVALPWYYYLRLGITIPLVLSAGLIAVVAAVLGLFGYLGRDIHTEAGGFGQFSANLNTFFNSMGHSRIFGALPHLREQYEGYCYLGAGCFLLGIMALVLLLPRATRANIASFPWRRAVWPLIAALGCAVLAFATPWYWGETKVLEVGLFEHLKVFTEPFRSSGRFIWPLAYLLNLACLTAVLRALRWQRWTASGALLVVLGLQAYDQQPEKKAEWLSPGRQRKLESPAWALADKDFRHVVLYPAAILGECDPPGGYNASEVSALAYLAYRHDWTFNSGYAARVRYAAREYCEELKREVKRGQLADDTLYVVDNRDVRKMRKNGAVCRRIDRVNVCVQRRDTPFTRHLEDLSAQLR